MVTVDLLSIRATMFKAILAEVAFGLAACSSSFSAPTPTATSTSSSSL
jgi:hypothetical protein